MMPELCAGRWVFLWYFEAKKEKTGRGKWKGKLIRNKFWLKKMHLYQTTRKGKES